MKRVFIKYNPYQVTTEITIDDQPLKKNSKLNVPDQRLQEWVDDLPDILFEECSTKDFEITFQGTVLDFEDVAAAAEDAKAKGINISLKHIPAKEVKDKEQAQDIADLTAKVESLENQQNEILTALQETYEEQKAAAESKASSDTSDSESDGTSEKDSADNKESSDQTEKSLLLEKYTEW